MIYVASTRKLRKQKGTGMARCGSNRSPIWVGGGIAFGPKPRNVKYDIPKKMRRKALRDAFYLKIKNKEVIILENLDMKEVKTKQVSDFLKKINACSRVLFVTEKINRNIILSARNIQKVKVLPVSELNAYEMISGGKLLFSREAFNQIVERVG